MPRKESRYFIALGFGIILFLTLVTGATSYNRLTTLKKDIDSNLTQHHVKSNLINQMHKIVSKRSLTIHNIMHSTDDPFYADNEFMQYNQLATEFVLLKEQFKALDLSEDEYRLFQEAMIIIRESQPLQDSLVNNALDGLHKKNTPHMIALDWNNEQRLYEKFNALLSIENNLSQFAYQSASIAYNDALRLLVLLSISIFLIGLFVAQYVVRRAIRAETALFEKKEQAEITLHAIGDAVITTDLAGSIMYFNPIAESIIEKSLDEVRGQALNSIIEILRKNKEPVKFAVGDRLAVQNLNLSNSTLICNLNNKEIPIEGTTSLVHDENNNIIGNVIIFRDVSEKCNLTDLLTWQATHDSLTGLVNRREYERLLGQFLEDSNTNRRTHAVLHVDLDQFKVVNDTCGHEAGDALLQQLAAILQSKVRGSDTISRLGGDEFGFLLDSCSLLKAESIAKEVLKTIQEFRFSWKNNMFKIGASIGVLGINNNSISVAKLMSDADAACYIAKEKGRNCVWVHRADDKEIAQRRGEMALTSHINKALENEGFTIYKQKIKSIYQDSHKDLYELLIRMRDASGKEVLPMTFIPAAEKYIMMPEIDRWMIKAVFSHFGSRKEDSENSEIVCINLSGQTLSQKTFLNFVVHEIESSNVNPQSICFEITETVAIANLQQVTQFISVLRGMGCKFALDDFGSGMSSFTYLRNFTVDYLKIDGSFVRNIHNDSVNREMVKAIHNLGQVMNIKTIAEYVESEEVMQELLEIGVDFAQGYSIHLPEPL